MAGMDRNLFRYIERQLYGYERTLKDLQELTSDIIGATVYPETQVSGGSISDTTMARTMQLVTNAAIAKMTRTIKDIDKGLALLSDDHRALFKLKYCLDLPWQQVCIELPCADRTYFKLRKEIVTTVAEVMGEIW